MVRIMASHWTHHMPLLNKIQAKTNYTMLTIYGVIFVNCKQVMVGSHKKVPNIINFLHNGITTLDFEALII